MLTLKRASLFFPFAIPVLRQPPDHLWKNPCITRGLRREYPVEIRCIALCTIICPALYSLSTAYTPFSTVFP